MGIGVLPVYTFRGGSHKMTKGDSKKRSARWIWLLAILLIAVFVLVLVRQGIFTGSGGGQKARDGSAASPSPDSASSRSPKNPAQAQNASPLDMNFEPSSSSSWYVTVAFKGTVRNEMDRAPIDGASVRIYGYSSPPSVSEKTTSSGGAFQVVAPPAYRYSVRVEAEGFRPYQDDSFVITRPYYDLNILMTPAYSLRGQVLDNVNNGIADARVQIRRFEDRAATPTATTTDSKGVFLFPEISRGGRFYVEVFHSGYDAQGAATVTIPAENEIVLRMNPARAVGSLAGTVTDKGRQSLPGARIWLYDPGDGRIVSTTSTDREGQYRLPKIREGYYFVRCTAEGFPDTQANQEVVAIHNNNEARLDFSLEPGLVIRGIVLNHKEEPVAQAQVTYVMEPASGGRAAMTENRGPAGNRMGMGMGPRGGMQQTRNLVIATTDSEGHFQILGLADAQAQFQVSISHRDYQTLVATLRPSHETQVLVLDPGLTLRGTVSDSRGAAVERFSLTFQTKSGRIEKSYSFTTSDGHFEIHGLARDSYQVSLESQGRGFFSGALDLQASAEIEVMLASGGGRGERGQSSLSLIKTK
jgi:flagellar basal body-associated protein FliL